MSERGRGRLRGGGQPCARRLACRSGHRFADGLDLGGGERSGAHEARYPAPVLDVLVQVAATDGTRAQEPLHLQETSSPSFRSPERQRRLWRCTLLYAWPRQIVPAISVKPATLHA